MPADPRDGIRELNPEELCRVWQPEEFSSDIEPEARFTNGVWLGLDQARLFGALDFGLSADVPNHHIFVAGITGPAVLEALEKFVLDFERKNKGELAQVRDWCYVFNFDNPRNPVAVPLPAGKAKVLKFKMKKNLSRLQEAIPKGLNNAEAVGARQRAHDAANKWLKQELAKIQIAAAEDDMDVYFEDGEFGVLPRVLKDKSKKKVIAMMDKFTPEETERYQNLVDKWMVPIVALRNELEHRNAKLREELKRINDSVIKDIVEKIFDSLRKKQISESSKSTPLIRYIDGLEKFAIENYPIFLRSNNPISEETHKNAQNNFLPWEVNVFVNNGDASGPPVIVELDPTFENLIGKMEKTVIPGGMVFTDHTKIVAGSLARANGGYLLLNIRDVLVRPGAYEALKNAIKNRTLEISELMSAMGYGSMSSLDPEPIPLNLKLVVTGVRGFWEYLSDADPEFARVFKIKAEVNPHVDRTPDEASAYARWMTRQYSAHGLLPLEKEAMGRIIDYASRVAGSSKLIATDFEVLQDIMNEASYVARKNNAERVDAEHVRKAIENRKFRFSLEHEHRLRYIREGYTLLDFEGTEIGQINGLVVFGDSDGDVRFGGPSRITAQISMGEPEFINVQRKSGMAGSYLDMADEIVNRYLSGTYARRYPLALQVSIAFEQSYGGVDGDSASLAQLYATLSAIAEVPIRQDIAITGSLNQRGAVQVIGGVNEKIEGFFDACLTKGELTGSQGVIIPQNNVPDLMLREDIVDAVRSGNFHIWAISHVNGGIKVLMDMDAGERGQNDEFPKGSFNALVDQKLEIYARRAQDFLKDKKRKITE